MKPIPDGSRFGRLVVLGEGKRRKDKNGTAITCLCQCDCGNKHTVRSSVLRRGLSKSCGCLAAELAKKRMAKQRSGGWSPTPPSSLIDLTGSRFGKLLVLSLEPPDGKRSCAHWTCRCDCGKLCTVRSAELLRTYCNPKGSCGCDKPKTQTLISGQIFGKWTVISGPIGQPKETRRYLCRCFCGKEKTVGVKYLIRWQSKTCGCSIRKPIKIGTQFGRLTVIGEQQNHPNGGYKKVIPCHCSCGKDKLISRDSLVSGKARSCRCLNSELASKRGSDPIRAAAKRGKPIKMEDLVGRRFGMLLVLHRDGRVGVPPVRWLCRCDCGNEKSVLGNNLKHTTDGCVKNCGCLWKIPDLSGKQLGHWTVLAPAITKAQSIKAYSCRCRCGRESVLSVETIQREGTKSCGCMRHKWTDAEKKEFGILPRFDEKWTSKMERSLRDLQPACVLCGSFDRLATDHFRPQSLGFGLEPGNATRLCIRCNSSKHAKHPDQLDVGRRFRIQIAAAAFEDHWNSQHAPA